MPQSSIESHCPFIRIHTGIRTQTISPSGASQLITSLARQPGTCFCSLLLQFSWSLFSRCMKCLPAARVTALTSGALYIAFVTHLSKRQTRRPQEWLLGNRGGSNIRILSPPTWFLIAIIKMGPPSTKPWTFVLNRWGPTDSHRDYWHHDRIEDIN